MGNNEIDEATHRYIASHPNLIYSIFEDDFTKFANWVAKQRGESPPETLGGGQAYPLEGQTCSAYMTIGAARSIEEYLQSDPANGPSTQTGDGNSCHSGEDFDD